MRGLEHPCPTQPQTRQLPCPSAARRSVKYTWWCKRSGAKLRYSTNAHRYGYQEPNRVMRYVWSSEGRVDAHDEAARRFVDAVITITSASASRLTVTATMLQDRLRTSHPKQTWLTTANDEAMLTRQAVATLSTSNQRWGAARNTIACNREGCGLRLAACDVWQTGVWIVFGLAWKWRAGHRGWRPHA
jgi:hypothetical protein